MLDVSGSRSHSCSDLASGIEPAQHLVTERPGPSAASSFARDIVVRARRDGQDAQVSALLRHRNHVNDLTHRVRDIIDAHISEAPRLQTPADAVAVNARTLTRELRPDSEDLSVDTLDDQVHLLRPTVYAEKTR